MGLSDGPIAAGPSKISCWPIQVNLDVIEKPVEDSLKLNLSEVPIIKFSGPKWKQLDKGFKVKNSPKDSGSPITCEKRKLCRQNTSKEEEISRVRKKSKCNLLKDGSLSKQTVAVSEQPH